MVAKRGAPRLYDKGAAHLNLSGDREIFDSFQQIMLREGTSCSAHLNEYMSKYIKDHGSGNPSFTITQWVDNKDFRAIPTLLSGREKWVSYLSDCKLPELVSIAGAARLVETIATEYWKDKMNTLPRRKTGIQEIQEALDKEQDNDRKRWG